MACTSAYLYVATKLPSSRSRWSRRAVVVGLVRAAEAKRIFEEELAERKRRWEEERLAAEERRRKAREKQERIDRLKRDAEAWTECERIRAYVEAVRQRAESDGPLDPDSELARWLDWAESYVVEIDPLEHFLGRQNG